MILSLVLLCLTDLPRPVPFDQPVRPPRPLQAMAHRGLWRVAPENTRSALEASALHLVEWAEVDVRLTKDGAHVLMHEDRVDRITDGKGLVADLTLAELLKLDAGSAFARRFAGTPPLSLEAALALAKGRLNLYLDCKVIDPARLVREIRAAGMERQVVVYGPEPLLAKVAEAARSGTAIALMKKWRPTDGAKPLEFPSGLAAVEVDAEFVNADACKVAHALGLKVQAKALGKDWDKPEIWERLANVGVDWVQTDWPIELHASLVNRGRQPIENRQRIAFSAHRGASRLAPENTLGAIEAAIALGADYVELDIRTTQDGGFVLLHDGTLNRTTDGKGPVAKARFDDVRRLDAGAWFGGLYRKTQVPTLDEALNVLKGRAKFYCDAKSIAPEALAEALRRQGMVEQTVVYNSPDALKSLMKVAPEIKRMPPLKKAADLDRIAAELKPFAFDVEWSIFTKELVDRCHAKGILVFSDALGLHETIDEYQKAMDLGVDLIQTDFPERVLRAIELRQTVGKSR